MQYEILKGHPSERECVIGAYEAYELMATYRGFYDRRRCSWTLYPLRRYALPLGVEFKKITLSERDVHLPKPKMEAKDVGAESPRWCATPSRSARSVKKDTEKTKAWWALPDPEGQLELL